MTTIKRNRPASHVAPALTRHQVFRLCAESLSDPRTVWRWYAGVEVRPSSAARLAAAARKLKLPLPRARPEMHDDDRRL